MASPSLAFIVENLSAAIVMVLYLWYEIHYGRLHKVAGKMDAIINAVVALAREHEDIDEQLVKDRLNGEAPADYVKKDDA